MHYHTLEIINIGKCKYSYADNYIYKIVRELIKYSYLFSMNLDNTRKAIDAVCYRKKTLTETQIDEWSHCNIVSWVG